MKHWKPLIATIAMVMVAACGPPQVNKSDSDKDEKTGTLRVWLFEESDNDAKKSVVDGAVTEFEDEHDDVTVDVSYIGVDTRSERFTGAFNAPESAPDVAEFDNTDLASYVAADGFAPLDDMLDDWSESDELSQSVLDTATIDGHVYGVPWFTGMRALYYRTDVFDELGLEPPETLNELVDTAKKIHDQKPDMYGIATGGEYDYALMPFIWAAGGDVATKDGDGYAAALGSSAARKGISSYASLIDDDNCPPKQCAGMTGNDATDVFAGGKAAMSISGDFNRSAMDSGDVADDYDVVPLPGYEKGSIAPAFAGGNLLGVLGSSDHATLSDEFVELLAGEKYQREMYETMGNLPTLEDVQEDVASDDPWIEPFVDTLQAGTEFVPASPAWSEIDAQQILPTMIQRIAKGKSVDDATDSAAKAMDKAFQE